MNLRKQLPKIYKNRRTYLNCANVYLVRTVMPRF